MFNTLHTHTQHEQFGRGRRSGARIKQQPDYSVNSAETYRRECQPTLYISIVHRQSNFTCMVYCVHRKSGRGSIHSSPLSCSDWASQPSSRAGFPSLGSEGEPYTRLWTSHSFYALSTVYPLQYLGCIPHVSDWQSPSSRTEFMQMVDEGQVH